MNGTNAVFAGLAIPTVAITGDPTIHALREKMNSRYEQKPGEKLPSRQRRTNACPGIHAGINAPARIYGLHETHGLCGMDLREARRNCRVVQIQSFDTVLRIHAVQTRDAAAAEIAASVIENRQLGHEAPACGGCRSGGLSLLARKFILTSGRAVGLPEPPARSVPKFVAQGSRRRIVKILVSLVGG